MKIRIKNIFVNKNANNFKEDKDKEKIKVNNSRRNSYKNLKLKKVYDATKESNDENVQNNTKDDNKKESNNVRKRKGYIVEEKKSNNKLNIYYQNLFKNKNKLNKGYYVLLISMVILGTFSIILASKTYKLFKMEDYEVFSNVESKDVVNTNETNNEINKTENEVELQSLETNNKDTVIDQNNDNNNNKSSTSNTANTVSKTNTNTSNNKKNEVKVVPLSFSKPIEGEILKVYSPDKVIYSKTLELWKVHDGIDIKVEEGKYIKAIERGTIEKVYKDSFLGTTIVIDHGQGYKSSYSNLDENVLVKAKQSIVKGQKIGKIGKTAIGEIKDESHLHFMLFKDNKGVDPTYIFK